MAGGAGGGQDGGAGGTGYSGAAGAPGAAGDFFGSGGGGGGPGGAGGAGGNQGAGGVSPGGAGGTAGTLTAPDGGDGASPASQGGGGGGGGGANGIIGETFGAAAVAGGNGGNGASAGGGTSGDGAGGGGAGGYGAIITGPNPGMNTYEIIGGRGGSGGGAYAGSGGGDGGIGAFFTQNATFVNGSTIEGGVGGTGGGVYAHLFPGVPGAVGGAGLVASNGAAFTNNGEILGGAGGTGGAESGFANGGQGGEGGSGVVGASLAITNNGGLAGGAGGAGGIAFMSQPGAAGAAGLAIDFTSGSNSLTLGVASTITGTISVDTAATSLTFAQPTDAGLANVIEGAGSISKTGIGTVTLAGANTYSGGTTIEAGTLDLAAAATVTNGAMTAGSAGTGAITFAGTVEHGAELRLGNAAQVGGGTFGNTLTNFGTNDFLDLRDFAFTGPALYSGGSTLVVKGGIDGTQTEAFTVVNGAIAYQAMSDGGGGTLLDAVGTVATAPASPPCYVTGTAIRTWRNGAAVDVSVEALCIGDLVVTASGAHRPIRWIGHRAYAARFANSNPDLLPICVKAGAIADAVPFRDLWLSPKHALFLDGVLIPAASLVNGVSILKAERIEDSLTYWHVELEGGHDVLLAEHTPAESFVDDNSRGIFHNAHTFHPLYPNAIEAEAVYCAPRVESGHILADVRRRLAERAGLAVEPAACFGDLRGHLDTCNGSIVTGWAQDALYPDAPVCLDVLVDGELVALTYADLHRPDLEAIGVGKGCHGFQLELPAASEAAHTVEVRRSADGAALAGSPWQVAIITAARAA